jgi:hypothetical protein
MSNQWEVKWWRVAVALACLFGILFLAEFVVEYWWMPWHDGQALARLYPNLRAVPEPVTDKTISKLDGEQVELHGVSLQAPWKVTKQVRGVLLFGDDRSLLFFDSLGAPGRISLMQQNAKTQKKIQAILDLLDTRTVSSDYNLMAAAMATTQADSHWWVARKENIRRDVLLTIKSEEVREANAVYEIAANELRGFQFGNPAAAPYDVRLVLFDRSDRRYEFFLDRKEKNAPFVTQAEVNAIVASIRPIPQS